LIVILKLELQEDDSTYMVSGSDEDGTVVPVLVALGCILGFIFVLTIMMIANHVQIAAQQAHLRENRLQMIQQEIELVLENQTNYVSV